MWLRAKAELQALKKKQEQDERLAKKKQKPRWLVLYENARAHRRLEVDESKSAE
jgi:hypothetical protein